MYERNTGIVVIRLVSNDPVPVGSTIQLRYDKVSTGLAVVKALFSGYRLQSPERVERHRHCHQRQRKR